MKVLRDLRRFILTKSAEGNHAEVRSYITENIDAVACAFHVPAETIMGALESVPDDAALAAKFLETTQRAEALLRQHSRDIRARSAQASAEALASAVQWQGDRAHVDVPSLFSSALTRRDDLLVFTCDAFTVSVYMAPLLDLARLQRVREDVSGWVDKDGLHLRWGRGGGGLNLRPQQDPDAAKVVLSLPPKAAIAA
jgi:hypothetical protein